jgi:hypothetical protein
MHNRILIEMGYKPIMSLHLTDVEMSHNRQLEVERLIEGVFQKPE